MAFAAWLDAVAVEATPFLIAALAAEALSFNALVLKFSSLLEAVGAPGLVPVLELEAEDVLVALQE